MTAVKTMNSYHMGNAKKHFKKTEVPLESAEIIDGQRNITFLGPGISDMVLRIRSTN